MRLLLLSIIALLVIAGCQVQTENPAPAGQEQQAMPGEEDAADHVGCQEGEIDQDGNCIVAEENNAGMFGQDLSDRVLTEQVFGTAQGIVARPKAEGSYPGVVMIHEWWGLNENIVEMAQILANEGYIVFAIDLYDGEVAETSDEARVLATSVRENPDAAIEKMEAAVDLLEERYGATSVGSLGWCFGGQQSLQLALNDELDATVIYYGSLTDDQDQLSHIDWPVLGIFGEEDGSIPPASVRSFESALDDLGIEHDITIYPGVGHAFANPSGSNYAPAETKDAWAKTLDFLAEHLRQGETDAMASGTSRQGDTVTFSIEGVNFAFYLDGVEAPELRVQQGDRVRIEFTSTDGFHDWVVDEFDVATERVQTGGSTMVEFVADKKGTFAYYCSVGSHRSNGMEGKLIVE